MENSQGKNILLIEDDEMMRILFRDTFWVHGTDECKIEIVLTRSLDEARTYLKRSEAPPHIIFMGLWLLNKNADGVMGREIAPSLEFIKEIRQNEAYKHICIVVYSRFNEAELKEQARDAGADHYLVKGELTPREMVDFVERL